MYISSVNNKIIKDISKLKEKKYRDITNTYLIEGEHLVNEAIKNNLVITIFSLEDYKINYPYTTYIVSKEVMKKLSDNPSIPKVMAVVKKIINNNYGNKIIMLDNIQDPGNLGTIIRSAVAFNFDTIILSNDTVDLYNPKVIRATQGMIFNINIIKDDIFNSINKLKKEDYTILATKVDNGKNIDKYQLKDKFAVIIGNEGQGINKDIYPLCDDNIYINMNSKCESLNAGVAASIIMYELGGVK